jgi:hypothetical protein
MTELQHIFLYAPAAVAFFVCSAVCLVLCAAAALRPTVPWSRWVDQAAKKSPAEAGPERGVS